MSSLFRSPKHISRLALTSIITLLLVNVPASAFSDIQNDSAAEHILNLKQRGIVNGMKEGTFAPQGVLTYAEGVHMLVKAFQLNTDNIRFMENPKASTLFAAVPDQQWYSDAFVKAYYNGLPLSVEVKPMEPMTREEFAQALVHCLQLKGSYAFPEVYILLADEELVNPALMNSIQILLIAKLAELDSSHQFHPKQAVTRSEAAAWLDKTLNWIENQSEGPAAAPKYNSDIQIDRLTDEIQKVTLTLELPHPGYGFRITTIRFTEDTALVEYVITDPDPNRMYPQVITRASAETYVPEGYKVEAHQIYP